MANQEKMMALFGGMPALRDQDAALEALSRSASLDPRSGVEGCEYLNFSGKLGRYSLGKDKEDVDSDELWLVNVHSFQNGWMCWKGGQVLARRMISIYDGTMAPPDMDEHGPFDPTRGEGWSPAKAFVLKSLESGVQALFSTNSKSGVSSVAGLEAAITRQLKSRQPEWPVIKLGKERFTTKNNTNFKPTFIVEKFISTDSVEELGSKEELTDEDIHALLEEYTEDRKKKGKSAFDDMEELGEGLDTSTGSSSERSSREGRRPRRLRTA